MLKKIFITLSLLLISGCTGKNIVKEENQESAYIIFKTPKMKYADMGFIYKGDSFVKVEVYEMGQPLFSLDINGMNICTSAFKCMEKSEFNKKMLISLYPDTLLENIFRGKAIFNGKNLEKNSNGFTQKIKKAKEYDITYSVDNKHKIFRDKINKIKIEVKTK